MILLSLSWLVWQNYTKTRLDQLRVYVPERFNSTRLKERILQQCQLFMPVKKAEM